MSLCTSRVAGDLREHRINFWLLVMLRAVHKDRNAVHTHTSMPVMFSWRKVIFPASFYVKFHLYAALSSNALQHLLLVLVCGSEPLFWVGVLTWNAPMCGTFQFPSAQAQHNTAGFAPFPKFIPKPFKCHCLWYASKKKTFMKKMKYNVRGRHF